MEKHGEEVHVDTVEASAGETSGHMRWVLGIGTVLAVVLLSLIWMTGAATQGDIEEEANVSGREASASSDTDTNSIVSDRVPEADEVGADTEVAE